MELNKVRSKPLIKDVLQKFEDVFSDELPNELLASCVIDHRIELKPRTKSLSKTSYRLNQTELIELRRHVIDLLTKQYIRFSNLSYGTLILYVGKKDENFV